MSDEFGLGWEIGNEDQHNIAIAGMLAPLVCSAAGDVPANNPCDWFLGNDQGQRPLCHAHSRTSAAEYLAWVATRGKVFQFSRRYAAIGNLTMDGNGSREGGASISGSVRASKQDGEADESLFPYFKPNERYSNSIPDGVRENANQHHIKSVVPNVRSYDDLDRGLSSGLCSCILGLDWTSGFASLRGVASCEAIPSGRFLGGHAVAAFSWITKSGERWPALQNSHAGWGVGMKCYLAPKVWDSILKNSRYGAFLVSDIELKDEPPPRPWDWIDSANFAGGGLNLDLGNVS